MKLRPDFAWAKPLPPLDALGLTPSTVAVSTAKFYRGGNNDTFAVGERDTEYPPNPRGPLSHIFAPRRHPFLSSRE